MAIVFCVCVESSFHVIRGAGVDSEAAVGSEVPVVVIAGSDLASWLLFVDTVVEELSLLAEAPNVGLHQVEMLATWGLTGLDCSPRASLVVQLDQINSSDASAWNLAHVDSVRDGSSEVVVPIRPEDGVVISVVSDEGAVVHAHRDFSVVGGEIGAIKSFHKEFVLSE